MDAFTSMQVSAHEIPAERTAALWALKRDHRGRGGGCLTTAQPRCVNILVYMLGKSSGSNFIGHRQQFNLPKPAVSESSRLV